MLRKIKLGFIVMLVMLLAFSANVLAQDELNYIYSDEEIRSFISSIEGIEEMENFIIIKRADGEIEIFELEFMPHSASIPSITVPQRIAPARQAISTATIQLRQGDSFAYSISGRPVIGNDWAFSVGVQPAAGNPLLGQRHSGTGAFSNRVGIVHITSLGTYRTTIFNFGSRDIEITRATFKR